MKKVRKTRNEEDLNSDTRISVRIPATYFNLMMKEKQSGRTKNISSLVINALAFYIEHNGYETIEKKKQSLGTYNFLR